MPAVTVDNILTLPRIEVADPTAIDRPVLDVVTAPTGYEGEGFPVRRAFAGIDLHHLDPFIHMDQMGEVNYAPGEPKGTPWHPHRGFETVTYMIDGIMEHQDSNGGGGTIGGGDTQWMTAGGGILHIETPPEHLVMSGGLFHGVQLWVNLPKNNKMAAPRYQDITGSKVALLSSHDGGALIRVIAGEIAGHQGPGSTYTPIALSHTTVAPGASVTLPWNRGFNALVYVLAGDGFVGVDRRPISSGQTAVFGRGERSDGGFHSGERSDGGFHSGERSDGGPYSGDTITITAANTQDSRTESLEVFILGGRPIREPIAMAGPFVMNTKAEVMQAFEDYQAGRLGSVPAAHESLD
ncbi:pirin family protein [Rhodococcus sp. ABRD24]|uniref:pirin family protein n=1 Tax=Rhodococcus sp. ABRD24 TaxID=2507582 RepID=UPI00103B3110|nr:pirin family protein [Rhodococcus sp. ABRD24]QBJ96148.1 pirin family protein [Rhodococcus sp. ABRD24]